jgi:glucokinase
MKGKKSWAMGIDLGGTKVEIAEVDREGNLGRSKRVPTEAFRGPAEVKKKLAEDIKNFIKQAGSPPLGIGIGVAGVVDPRRGVVRLGPNLGWTDVPIKEELERAVNLPVVVGNDVRSATRGEWLFGAGKGCDDFICIFVGTGIGGGIVSGGRLLSGVNYTAGEIGHMMVEVDGPLCACGNRGCWEALASGTALAAQARDLIRRDPSKAQDLLELAEGKADAVTAAVVAQAYKQGSRAAGILVDNLVLNLIAGIVTLVNVLNPARCLLGGGVMEGFPDSLGRIREGVRKRALVPAVEKLEILPARLGSKAPVMGAASLVFESLGKL